ncbi:MAG: DUF4352 domain-containing protein [Bryobacterales bacterium]|nr:DUF4352 domain-containing protein [Bryobacterales bacterium]
MVTLVLRNQNHRIWRLARRISSPVVTIVLVSGCLLLAGCGTKSTTVNAKMGETVTLGNVEHAVLSAEWKAALGQGAETRMPSQQFLVLRMATTNKQGDGAEIASMRLVAANGTEYEELADGSGLPDWFGLVRMLNPGESRQGTVLFDAPRAVYTLKLTEPAIDGDDANVALVEIPIRIEDSAIPTSADPTGSAIP